MKKSILSVVIMSIALATYAGNISCPQARRVACEFMGWSNSITQKNAKTQAENPADAGFYVFEQKDGEGFVIVGGDSSLPKIIGYSHTGRIDVDNLPPQLDSILAGLPDGSNEFVHPSWNCGRSYQPASSANKILKTAQWGQGAPYNLDCPENCVTGCVTTAMAIVMKYHGWPRRGRGSNSNPYDSDRGEYSFDTEYDWDNALMDYSNYYESPGSYTDAQVNAVAKIMHDCATAIEAAFYPGWMTSADEHDCAYALRNFFYYDGNIGYSGINEIDVHGDYALSYIQSEIDADRPLIMAGYNVSSGVGHAWVVDGYDSNGMVHINWGWDGGANGFFAYPLANDYMTGTLVYNIMPAEKWVEYSPWEIIPSGNLNIDVTDVIQNEYFNAYCYHVTSPNIFHSPQMEPICSGSLAVALTDANGNIKEILRELKITDWFNDRLKGNQYFTGLRVTKPIDNTDRIELISKPTGYNDWIRFGNAPFTITWRPVRGNRPKVADVRINFIGDKFPYSAYSVNTTGKYLQTKPMASSSYIIDFQYPADKEKIWVAVNEQYPIGATYSKSHPQPPMAYIDLPYRHNAMTYNVTAMAFNENDLIQDWTVVNLSEPGTLRDRLTDEVRIRTRKLRVTGVMNSDDFFYIRDEMPLIKHLDLKDARIAADFYNSDEDYIPRYALMRKRLDSIILPSALKGIGIEALRSNSFSRIELPATLEYLGLGAFWEEGDVDLMDVICNNPVPPVIQAAQFGNEEHMFEQSTYKRATLWLPEGSKNDYQSQPYVWHNFVKVKEFVPAGIEDVSCDNDEGYIEIFDVRGILIYAGETRVSYNIPPGIYIYRRGMSSGKIAVNN